MTSDINPIIVHGKNGPNPIKVALILAELKVPHKFVDLPFTNVKAPEFLAINPNGRMPAIQDPNTGLTLWESGAIIEYLIEKYDEDNALSFAPGSNEDFLTKQWLYFQTSGQGPYYGQFMWFTRSHPETIPSAIDRYADEVERVTNVLETWLETQVRKSPQVADGPWLVGGRMTYADIAFLPWQYFITQQLGQERMAKYSLVADWLARIAARERVQPVFAESLAALERQRKEADKTLVIQE